jgi:hypothetical protein
MFDSDPDPQTPRETLRRMMDVVGDILSDRPLVEPTDPATALQQVPPMSGAMKIALLPRADQEEMLDHIPPEELLDDPTFWAVPA